MNTKLIITLSLLLATIGLSAQEVDPVLDAKITALAKEKFPKDKKKRKEVYQQQWDAYNALATMEDYAALSKAKEKFAEDYSMQLHVYNQQVNGKKYMELADDKEAKELATTQYSGDYHMQSYVYQRNLEARGIDPTPKQPAPVVAQQPEQPQTLTPVQLKAKPTQAPAQKASVQKTSVQKTVAKQPSQTVLAPAAPKQKSFVPAAVVDKIRALVVEYFPDDADLQQEIFDEQVAAFQFLFDASDKNLREVLFKRYPYDFVAQKNEYISIKENEAATPAP